MDPSVQISTRQIGRYHLVDRLAIGGMAEVFLATADDPDGKLVVIKRLLPHLARLEEFVAAFEREALVAMQIAHPNVVRILESGVAGDLPFIAMEYIHGSSVRELCTALTRTGEAAPVGVAVDLLGQACAGAHAAHELKDADGRPYGLVHRDITPHNLMIDCSGHLWLLDFGIAKSPDGDEQTRTGVLKGKIAYMSPEQCRQERLDRRSDVFSLGVVGYQLLTGHKPFRGSSELATMQAVLTCRPAPLRDLRPDIPEGVARAVERALAARPEDRFDDAEAFGLALARAAAEAGVTSGSEQVVAMICRVLGPEHDKRRRDIDRAVEMSQPWSDAPPMTESIDRTPTHPRAPSAPPPEQRRTLAALAWPAAAVALAGLWLGVRPLVEAEVGAAPAPSWTRAAPVLLELAPTLAPEALRRDLEPLRLYLSDAIRRPVALSVADSYQEAADAVVSGRAPYGMLPPSTVARARERDPELEVIAIKRVDGSTSSDGFLLVRRDDPIADVSALRGRTVCWTDPWSLTGYLLPSAFLRSHGLDPDRDVVAHWSGDHEAALRDLLSGACDAAATFSNNYETANQRGFATARVRILAITGQSPHDAVLAGPAADPEVTEALRAALLSFAPSPDSTEGESERITGFAPPPEGYPALP